MYPLNLISQTPMAFLLQTGPGGTSIAFFVQLLLIGAVFYFLLFMPMQRQKKRQAQMLAELRNGDVVITTGGIVGTITGVDSDTIVLRVKPDNIKLQFSRAAISTLVPPEGSK